MPPKALTVQGNKSDYLAAESTDGQQGQGDAREPKRVCLNADSPSAFLDSSRPNQRFTPAYDDYAPTFDGCADTRKEEQEGRIDTSVSPKRPISNIYHLLHIEAEAKPSTVHESTPKPKSEHTLFAHSNHDIRDVELKDIVCFGMVRFTLTAILRFVPTTFRHAYLGLKLDGIAVHEQQQIKNHEPLESYIPVRFSNSFGIMQLEDTSRYAIGRLDPHYSKLLEVILKCRRIELQPYVIPTSHQTTALKRPRQARKGQQPASSPVRTLSVVFYGPMQILDSVGDFLLKCSEYLQSPLHCDRNVPYINPQSLSGRDTPAPNTFDLVPGDCPAQIEKVHQAADPAALLETEFSYPEAEAPRILLSHLYRYNLSSVLLPVLFSHTDTDQSSKASFIFHAGMRIKWASR